MVCLWFSWWTNGYYTKSCKTDYLPLDWYKFVSAWFWLTGPPGCVFLLHGIVTTCLYIIHILSSKIKKEIVNLMCCYCLDFNEDNKNSGLVPLLLISPSTYIFFKGISNISGGDEFHSFCLPGPKTVKCFFSFFPLWVCNCAIQYLIALSYSCSYNKFKW